MPAFGPVGQALGQDATSPLSLGTLASIPGSPALWQLLTSAPSPIIQAPEHLNGEGNTLGPALQGQAAPACRPHRSPRPRTSPMRERNILGEIS